MMLKIWVPLITVTIALFDASALAEIKKGDGTLLIAPLSQPAEFSSLAAKWEEVAKGSPRDEVVKILAKEGWAPDQVKSAIGETGKFNVYSKAISPGVKSFFAVPAEGVGQPVQFGQAYAGMQQGVVSASWYNPVPSKEEIRKKIIDGIQASIEAVCEMPARPKEIRARASAFGLVEIEALWGSADVCGSL